MSGTRLKASEALRKSAALIRESAERVASITPAQSSQTTVDLAELRRVIHAK